DEVDSFVRLEARGDFHAGVRSGAAELEGVAEEVCQDLLQESPVPDRRWQILQAHLGVAVARDLSQVFERGAGQARHIDRLQLQRLSAEAGKPQQGIDQL